MKRIILITILATSGFFSFAADSKKTDKMIEEILIRELEKGTDEETINKMIKEAIAKERSKDAPLTAGDIKNDIEGVYLSKLYKRTINKPWNEAQKKYMNSPDNRIIKLSEKLGIDFTIEYWSIPGSREYTNPRRITGEYTIKRDDISDRKIYLEAINPCDNVCINSVEVRSDSAGKNWEVYGWARYYKKK